MAFKQTYKKAIEVINIDNGPLVDGGDTFDQTFDDVYKIINTKYDDSQIGALMFLMQNLSVLNEGELQKLYEEVNKQRSVSTDMSKLSQFITDKKNTKLGIEEYIKTGTATLTFINTLLAIVNTILGFCN